MSQRQAEQRPNRPTPREQGRLPQTSLTELRDIALRDAGTAETVNWLYTTHETPTREELTGRGLTEFSYLAFLPQGRGIDLDLGGGASNAAAAIAENTFRNLIAQGVTEVNYLVGIHGAIMFPEEGINQQVRDTRPDCVLNAAGMHVHDGQQARNTAHSLGLANQMACACGLGEGSTLVTRQKALDQVRTMRATAEQLDSESRASGGPGFKVNLVAFEADVSTASNQPLFRVYRDDGSSTPGFERLGFVEDDFTKGLHADTSYPVQELMSLTRFNDYLRGLMDSGVALRGIACADPRQGQMFTTATMVETGDLVDPVTRQQTFDPRAQEAHPSRQALIDELGLNRNGLGNSHGLEHADSMVVWGPSEDEAHERTMAQVALYMATHPTYMLRNLMEWGGQDLVPSMPLYVKYAGQIFSDRASQIAGPAQALLSNIALFAGLDRPWLARLNSQTLAGPSKVYTQTDAGFVEVESIGRMPVLYSDDNVGRALAGLQVGRPRASAIGYGTAAGYEAAGIKQSSVPVLHADGHWSWEQTGMRGGFVGGDKLTDLRPVAIPVSPLG